jgi:exopolysaccharide production protein ExoQ
MPPSLALLACTLGVAALLVADQRWRPGISGTLWLPLLWVLIISSRPVSLWFAPPDLFLTKESYQSYVDGNLLDRNFYLAMIVAGLIVLARRKIWKTNLLRSNKWLLLYFAYFALSALWSDDPLVSFKRWVKDFGNVVMVLIVLSELNPVEAVKGLLVRASYVLVPFSVLLVKYFPGLGTEHIRWTGAVFWTGVTTDKNQLGMTLTVLGVSLVWVLLEQLGEPRRLRRRTQAASYAALLVMIVWLMIGAKSATAIACTTVGVSLLIAMHMRAFRLHVRAWGMAGLVLGLLLAMSGAWTTIQDTLVERLGRDPTLHGREEIWAAVLGERTNPLFGSGYYSFWTADRVERLSAKYFYDLNEAHNGFLEVYLTGGLIGLGLLAALLWNTTIVTTRGLVRGASPGLPALGLALVAVSVLYGVTEAMFSRLTLTWFGLLLVAVGSGLSGVAAPSSRVLPPRRKIGRFTYQRAPKDSRGAFTRRKRSGASRG